MDELKGQIESRSAVIAVVGLGYVGLPLAIETARAGFNVIGFDVSEDKIRTLSEGRSTVIDLIDDEVAEQIQAGRFTATVDPGGLDGVDIFVICVPTPLKHELPDMSFIEQAGTTVAAHLQPGALVILESTTYPGTTQEFLAPILESHGLVAGGDFYLGFSPERVDPGNTTFGVTNTPKVVGGVDEHSTLLMEAFYSTFISKVVTVSSPKAAETTKLLENTYRHINIALANEMAILCHDLGVDIWEVIDAAATKPFGFHPFYPGPGWGGHCIPVDPAYLSWRVRQMGSTAHFVELAREINDRMPVYVTQRISDLLNESGESMRGSKVLILGVTYKADIDDTREAPANELINRLLKKGAEVSFNDPYVERLTVGETTLECSELTKENLETADVVVVITAHTSYDWNHVAKHATKILDTRNALKDIKGKITRL